VCYFVIMVPKNEKEKTLNMLPPEREKYSLLTLNTTHSTDPSAAPTFPWPGTPVGSLDRAPLQPVHGFPGRGVAVVA